MVETTIGDYSETKERDDTTMVRTDKGYIKKETRWVAKGDEHTTANDLFPRCTWNDKASRCDTHQHSWCEDNVKYMDTRGDGCSTGSNPWKGRCDDIPDRALYPNISDEDWPPQDTQEWIARVRKECPRSCGLCGTDAVHTPRWHWSADSAVPNFETTLTESCEDDTDFKDGFGDGCTTGVYPWAGECNFANAITSCVGMPATGTEGFACEVDGYAALGTYYTKAMMDQVRKNCPLSCGICQIEK